MVTGGQTSSSLRLPWCEHWGPVQSLKVGPRTSDESLGPGCAQPPPSVARPRLHIGCAADISASSFRFRTPASSWGWNTATATNSAQTDQIILLVYLHINTIRTLLKLFLKLKDFQHGDNCFVGKGVYFWKTIEPLSAVGMRQKDKIIFRPTVICFFTICPISPGHQLTFLR